jgi:hypothetical protein
MGDVRMDQLEQILLGIPPRRRWVRGQPCTPGAVVGDCRWLLGMPARGLGIVQQRTAPDFYAGWGWVFARMLLARLMAASVSFILIGPWL